MFDSPGNSGEGILAYLDFLELILYSAERLWAMLYLPDLVKLGKSWAFYTNQEVGVYSGYVTHQGDERGFDLSGQSCIIGRAFNSPGIF